MALTKAEAKKAMLSVKGTSEGPFFGRPSVFYGEDFVARVHDKEDAVACRIGSIEMRDVMLEAEPKLFYITDHYRKFPMLLARLSTLTASVLKELVQARMREIDAKPKRKKRVRKEAAKPVKKTAKAPKKKAAKKKSA
jgi:hypothetical protein